MFESVKNIYKTMLRNEIANRFAKVFSVDVLVKGSTFLLLPVYLHLMTQEEVGTFNYIFVFIQTISVLLIFGLYQAQSKLYHDYKGIEREQLLFSINLVLFAFLAVILLPIYVFGFDFQLMDFVFGNSINYELFRWPLLLAFITSVGSYLLFNYLLTSENIRKVQIYNLLKMIISNGIVIVILYVSKSDKVITRLIVYYLCEIMLWICFLFSYVKQFRFTFDWEKIKRILSICIPTFLLSLISTILGFSDKYFVRQKTDMSIMAVYTVGITISSVCYLVIMSFQNVWMPIFLKEKNVEENFRKTGKLVKIIIGSFIGIAVIMIIGVKIALMFNIIPTSYGEVLKILPFLFIAQIISSVNTLYGNYFLYFNRMTLGSLVGGSVYIVSFFINFWLIPRYGVTGAVIAILLNNIVLLTIVYSVVKHLYRNNINS